MPFDPMYIWLGVAPRCQEKFLRFQEASAWTCFPFCSRHHQPQESSYYHFISYIIILSYIIIYYLILSYIIIYYHILSYIIIYYHILSSIIHESTSHYQPKSTITIVNHHPNGFHSLTGQDDLRGKKISVIYCHCNRDSGHEGCIWDMGMGQNMSKPIVPLL